MHIDNVIFLILSKNAYTKFSAGPFNLSEFFCQLPAISALFQSQEQRDVACKVAFCFAVRQDFLDMTYTEISGDCGQYRNKSIMFGPSG